MDFKTMLFLCTSIQKVLNLVTLPFKHDMGRDSQESSGSMIFKMEMSRRVFGLSKYGTR